jgi:hypothetical protein
MAFKFTSDSSMFESAITTLKAISQTLKDLKKAYKVELLENIFRTLYIYDQENNTSLGPSLYSLVVESPLTIKEIEIEFQSRFQLDSNLTFFLVRNYSPLDFHILKNICKKPHLDANGIWEAINIQNEQFKLV